MSLQTVLIIIGCIVIALVYVATRVTTRKSIDKNRPPFVENAEDQEFFGDSHEETLLNEGHIRSQLDLDLSEDPQLGLFESTDGASQYVSESEDLTDKNEVIETPSQDDTKILKVFLKPKEEELFLGMDILRSLNHVGMTFGEMGIFHKIVENDSGTLETLFSAANMFEPGSFNLQMIETEQCRGLVFFMEIPTIIDDGVALETLLTTTDRVAKLLGGMLYKTPNDFMDDDFLDALRLKTNFIIDND